MNGKTIDLIAAVILIVLCLALLKLIPNDICDDDTYAIDRGLFSQSVRERCENSGQQ
jgi:hypothetical protein